MEYVEKEEWYKAIQAFRTVLEEDPKDYESRKAIAFSYFENDQYEEAIDEYNSVLEKFPEDQNIISKIIDAHYKLATLQVLQIG